jgi:hypothetical protein
MNDILSRYAPLGFIAALVILLLVLCAAWFRECNRNDEHTDKVGTGIQIIRDTTIRIVPETRIEYRTKSMVKWLPFDTTQWNYEHARICDSIAFEASIDTVIGKIRIRDTFAFPSMVFRTRVDRTADSMIVIDKTIFMHDTLVRSNVRPWWQDVLMTTGAAAIGYVVAKNTR